ncbi:MAG: Ty1/Copia family ribonuclease HI, partial [bacterium]
EDYEWVCSSLEKHFKITRKGQLKYGLGIDVEQTVENGVVTKIKLHQKTFTVALLTEYGFLDSKPVSTPAVPNTCLVADMKEYKTHKNDHQASKISIENYPRIVGSILWANLQTRPDISQATNQLTRFVAKPCQGHLIAVKHLLRYLNGTRDYGLTYSKSGNAQPEIYSDATWGSIPLSMRSVNAYVVILYNAAISWHCGSQKSVSLSTTESEYFALSETVKEAVYIKHALTQMKFAAITHWNKDPMIIFEDNQAVINVVKGDINHKHQKHILIRLAYTREQFHNNIITPVYIRSEDNIADVLTKNLPQEPFIRFRKCMLGSG